MHSITASRANISGHAHLVVAHVNVGDGTALVFFPDDDWARLLDGAALEVVPEAICVDLVDGVGGCGA